MNEIARNYSSIALYCVFVAFLAILFAAGSAADSRKEENKNARIPAIIAAIALALAAIFFMASHYATRGRF